MDDIINSTGGCTVFSRLDLVKGYWQMHLTEETRKFAAFQTPWGIYEFNRLPFGWKNSGAWFQFMMHDVFLGLAGHFRTPIPNFASMARLTQKDIPFVCY